MPGVIQVLEARGIHRTEVYRYAAGTVTPAADRAAVIEAATTDEATRVIGVPANGWGPDADAADDAPDSPPKNGTEG